MTIDQHDPRHAGSAEPQRFVQPSDGDEGDDAGRGQWLLAHGGDELPGDEHPDYWDFFYFTTSIGATSQTSDVAITSKAMRRMVAFQAVLSFLFNTAVVALAINLASALV